MAGPEDEFQDELNDENPAASGDASPADSGLDLAPDVAMAGEVADEKDEYAYTPDDDQPADLSRELADDAGDKASYGFENASETARFTQKPDDVDRDLTEAANTPDESDRFRPVETPDEPPPQFAEELGSPSDSYRVEDDPAASHSELQYTDDPKHLDEPEDEVAADTGSDSGISYAEGAPDVAPEPEVAEPEPEVAPEPEPAPAPPPPRPRTREAPPPKPAPPPAPAASADDKPGAVRRSAIDEMFARAAELKRRKGE